MTDYERQSFLKIFLSYFISVTIFVLLLGYLYFQQQKTFILQKTAMSMHHFLIQNKQNRFQYTQKGYHIKFVRDIKINMALPQKYGNLYVKAFSPFVIVTVDASIVDNEISDVKRFTIIIQILLIIIFAIISFLVAKMSLKPMSDILLLLDNFTKDLIHDLNTPITSILLNTKLLKKSVTKSDIKKVDRIEQSAKNISSLYDNLEIILKDNKLLKEEVRLDKIVTEIVEIYKPLYPHIKFNININNNTIIYSNINAIKRIIDNILSNSSKYSKNENAVINIKYENNVLIIEDNGKGMKNPENVFTNHYTENSKGHGIGMYIVHRLCDTLSHKIVIQSQEDVGTKVILTLS